MRKIATETDKTHRKLKEDIKSIPINTRGDVGKPIVYKHGGSGGGRVPGKVPR